MSIRVVLHGFEQAALLVDNESKYVRVGKGVAMYVAFLKKDDIQTISDALIEKAVKSILKKKMFNHFKCTARAASRPLSLESCPEIDILILPQASLGGSTKDRIVQYYTLPPREESIRAYNAFCHRMRIERGIREGSTDSNGQRSATTLALQPDVWEDGKGFMSFPPTEGGAEQGSPQRGLKCDGRVVSGTFANYQGLQMYSEDPYTHFVEIFS